MKNCDIKELNEKEFFLELEDKKKELSRELFRINNYKEIFENFCFYNEKINLYQGKRITYKQLTSDNKFKNKFKIVLSFTLGDKLFEYSNETNKKLQKDNIFTKNDLYNIIKKSSLVSMTNSYDELVNTIVKLVKNAEERGIDYKNTCDILNKLYTFIISKYKEIYEGKNENQLFIEEINKILKNYRNKNIIKIDQNTIKLQSFLNKSVLCVLDDEKGNINYEHIEFGDIMMKNIEKFNETIINKKRIYNIKAEANSYYKNLKSKPFSELKNSDFPSYDNNDVVQVYKILNKKISDYALKNKDEDCLNLMAISNMMYAGYFKSNYYDENKVQEKPIVLKRR